MASPTDFPAKGKVLRVVDGQVVFNPTGSNYELLLDATSVAANPEVVSGFIRVKARKVWTVPSGGNFIGPIFGSPRLVQGRVRYLDDNQMVVQASTPVIVTLPKDETAYDLANGPLMVGALVNVPVVPESKFELVKG